jgi:hypothetical protein
MNPPKDSKKKSVFANNEKKEDDANSKNQENIAMNEQDHYINPSNKVFQVSKSGSKRVKGSSQRHQSNSEYNDSK